MISLEQKGRWDIYFMDIDHVLIFSTTLEITPRKHSRVSPVLVPGRKNKLVLELGVDPGESHKRTGLKRLGRYIESLGIINLEEAGRGNTSYNPVMNDKNWKKIYSLEISLKTIIEIIKEKDDYLIVGDYETMIDILRSSETLKFL